MAGVDFFATRMGAKFYEATVPRIADELERLNRNLEQIVAELRRSNTNQAERASEPVTSTTSAHGASG